MRVLELGLALERAAVLVEDGDGEEVSADRALERRRYLHHPVHHLSSVLLADVVLLQR